MSHKESVSSIVEEVIEFDKKNETIKLDKTFIKPTMLSSNSISASSNEPSPPMDVNNFSKSDKNLSDVSMSKISTSKTVSNVPALEARNFTEPVITLADSVSPEMIVNYLKPDSDTPMEQFSPLFIPKKRKNNSKTSKTSPLNPNKVIRLKRKKEHNPSTNSSASILSNLSSFHNSLTKTNPTDYFTQSNVLNDETLHKKNNDKNLSVKVKLHPETFNNKSSSPVHLQTSETSTILTKSPGSPTINSNTSAKHDQSINKSMQVNPFNGSPSTPSLPQGVNYSQQFNQLNSNFLNSSIPSKLTAHNSGFISMPKQLGVEDALAYLDKVKRQFSDRLEIYNQFLEIMKNFKSQNIDTPGVINHVCKLFKGHDNLILGFNTFLPPGFKIELPINNVDSRIREVSITTENHIPQQKHAEQLKMEASNDTKDNSEFVNDSTIPNNSLVQQTLEVSNNKKSSSHSLVNDQNSFKPHSNNYTVPNPDEKPIEFDHAISYITKIQNRFSTETKTFKTFLDILHCYQNEQHSINEVLDQVYDLFQGHLDLLKEFTYFLPNSIRDSALLEIMNRTSKPQNIDQKSKVCSTKIKKPTPPSIESNDVNFSIPSLDYKIINRIKDTLGDKDSWKEFLKCLDLFAQDLISRSELFALLNDLFSNDSRLLEEFSNFLSSHGASDEPTENAWFSMPLSSIDFSNCRHCTPSYRALPNSYPKPTFSERTAICRSVLNDTWVSVPIGSEDSNGPNHRYNQYQEAMFKCEDDRYEIDMLIETNKSAIAALEPLAHEIQTLIDSESQFNFRFRLEKRALSVIHLKAISQVYGNHGAFILELLRRNPAGAIPIILNRLKEKEKEWSRNRIKFNDTWKKVMEQNYFKSFNTSSFYFKQSEKRSFTSKILLAELRKKNQLAFKDEITEIEHSNESYSTSVPSFIENANNTAREELCISFEDVSLHYDVWGLIGFNVEKECNSIEAENIASFFVFFLHPLLQLPEKWLNLNKSPMEILNHIKLQKKIKSDLSNFEKGSEVITPYGTGIIENYDSDQKKFQVILSYGTGYFTKNIMEPFVSDQKKLEYLIHCEQMSDTDINMPVLGKKHLPENLFTSSSMYVFLRQYHILYERFLNAKIRCEKKDSSKFNNMSHSTSNKNILSSQLSNQDDFHDDKEDNPLTNGFELPRPKLYTQLLSVIYTYIDGILDSKEYEDKCQSLIGSASFHLFTIRELVSEITKQLTYIVTDSKSENCGFAINSYLNKKNYHSNQLANVYQDFHDHLIQLESVYLHMRFIPGVLSTNDDTAPSNNQIAESNLFSIVNKKIYENNSKWERTPSLVFSLSEYLPIYSFFHNNKQNLDTILIPYPIQVVVSNKLTKEKIDESCIRLNELTLLSTISSTSQSPKSDQSKPDRKLYLPVYRFINIPFSKKIKQALEDFIKPVLNRNKNNSKSENNSNQGISPENSSVTNPICLSSMETEVCSDSSNF